MKKPRKKKECGWKFRHRLVFLLHDRPELRAYKPAVVVSEAVTWNV